MADNSNFRWYVVNTHSGFENKAREALATRVVALNVQDKFGEILVPVETIVEHKKAGQKKNNKEIFSWLYFGADGTH